jgi:hypothetical protein
MTVGPSVGAVETDRCSEIQRRQMLWNGEYAAVDSLQTSTHIHLHDDCLLLSLYLFLCRI